MNTYWPARPRKVSTSACTCSGVNATQSTTASNSRCPSSSRTWSGSRASPCRTRAAAGSGRALVWPRVMTDRSMPWSTASRAHAELITPVPPRKRTLIPVTPPTVGRPASCAAPAGPSRSGRYDGQEDVPDLDLVALLQQLGRVDAASVQPGAVGRAQVLDVPQVAGDFEAGVLAGGEVVVDDERALPPRGEVGVKDVLPVCGPEDQGLRWDGIGESHAGLPGDRGYGGPPRLLLRLSGVFPGRESAGMGPAGGFGGGAGEAVNTGHLSMMADSGAWPWSISHGCRPAWGQGAA